MFVFPSGPEEISTRLCLCAALRYLLPPSSLPLEGRSKNRAAGGGACLAFEVFVLMSDRGI